MGSQHESKGSATHEGFRATHEGFRFGGDPYPASVWRLRHDLSIRWGFDTGSTTFDVTVDASGNVYVAGNRSNSWTGAGGTYASVWALSSSGEVLWTVDTGDNTYGVSTDGTYVWVVGDTTNGWPGAGGADAAAWKLDASDGSVEWGWDRPNPFGSDDSLRGVGHDSSGNAYVGGSRETGSEPTDSVWKLNSSGSETASYGATSQPYVQDIVVDGDVWVAYNNGGTAATVTYELVKLNTSLSLQWGAALDPGTKDARAVATDGTNSWLAGEEQATSPDQHVFKYDSSGSQQWDYSQASSGGGRGVSVSGTKVFNSGEASGSWEGHPGGGETADIWQISDTDQSVAAFARIANSGANKCAADSGSVYLSGSRTTVAP